jgi:hypothetical protein
MEWIRRKIFVQVRGKWEERQLGDGRGAENGFEILIAIDTHVTS